MDLSIRFDRGSTYTLLTIKKLTKLRKMSLLAEGIDRENISSFSINE
jgi:hypothetical protein